MSCRREVSRGPGGADRTWLSCRQFVGVAAFVALFAALVVWTTVAMPGPIADLNVQALVPALTASAAASGQPAKPEEVR